MPTRDDAAYKAAYKQFSADMPDVPFEQLLRGLEARLGTLRLGGGQGRYDIRTEAMMDAEADELMRRGLCASVLDWHKKPAGDELPW